MNSIAIRRRAKMERFSVDAGACLHGVNCFMQKGEGCDGCVLKFIAVELFLR
jgi:hypothetical protein